jgi:AcrR family transcriptional regulator
MTRNADATRLRLLEAAIDEFAAHGLAGGRVDRVAAAARANKRAIYDYYGSKEALFAEAVRAVSERLVAAVPLNGEDIPGYAGALFDYVLAHPETGRLIRWRQLEYPEAPNPTSAQFFAELASVRDAALTAHQRINPVDLVILVIALANAWELVGHELAVANGGDPEDPHRITAHRAAVVEASRRLTG